MTIILDSGGETGDLTTVEAVRLLLRTPGADLAPDPLIQTFITQASVMIPRELGREFVASDDVTRTFTYAGRGWVNLAPYDLRVLSSVTYDPDGTAAAEIDPPPGGCVASPATARTGTCTSPTTSARPRRIRR
jgi:hypothetical protein